MAKKDDKLSFNDLVAGLEKSNLKVSDSIAEQLKVAQEQLAADEESKKEAKEVKEVSKREQSLAEKQLKVSEHTLDFIKAGLYGSAGNGLNGNVIKLISIVKDVAKDIKMMASQGRNTSPGTDASEQDIENQKVQDKQLKLLEKIADNTTLKEKPSNEPTGEGGGGGIFGKIGAGLKSFGKGLSGMAKNFLAIAAATWVLSKALQNFSTIDWTTIGKASASILALGLAAKLAGSGDSYKSFIGLTAALFGLTYVLEKFAKIEWETLGKAGAALAGMTVALKVLSSSAKDVLLGSVALLAAGGALYVMAKALTVFSEISWEDLGKAAAALIGFSAAVGILGALMTTGVGAIVFGAGIVAILALGAALGVLGAGALVAGAGMDSIVPGLTSLSNINGTNLLLVAGGVMALSAALATFAAGNVVAAIGNLVTKFLSIGQDSPLEQLKKISTYGPGIEKAALGLERMATAIQKFGQVDPAKLKEAVDAAAKIAKTGATIQLVTTPSQQANTVYNKSAENVERDKTQPQGKAAGTTVVNTQQVNNQTQNALIKSPVRNSENTLTSYLKTRYV